MTLQEELPRLFNELANDHAVGSPPRLDACDIFEPSSQRSRVLVGLAATAAVTALIGGLVVLSDRESDPPAPVTQPADRSASPAATSPTAPNNTDPIETRTSPAVAAPSQTLTSCRDRSLTIPGAYVDASVDGDISVEVVPTESGGIALLVRIDGLLVAGGCVPAETAQYLRENGDGIYAVTPVGDGLVVGLASQGSQPERTLAAGLGQPVATNVNTIGHAEAYVIREGEDPITSSALISRAQRSSDDGTVMFGAIDLPA